MHSLVFALLMAACSLASAFEWEVGLGRSYATAHNDGVWYQQAFPHSMDLSSTALKIGATGQWNRNLRWHLDAVHLGRYSSDGWATPHDDNYNANSPTGCNGHCLPLVRFTGSGTVGGFAATVEAHTAGLWKLGVEGGPFVYRSSWKMRVPGWYPSVMGDAGQFEAVAPPRDLNFGGSAWKVGAVAGLTVGRGPWTLSLRRYMSSAALNMDEGEWPPIWRHHTVLMLNYRFD